MGGRLGLDILVGNEAKGRGQILTADLQSRTQPQADSTVCCHRSGELRTQKLKSHLVRTQSLNILPFKPGVGQYIAIHPTLTARDFFLANF